MKISNGKTFLHQKKLYQKKIYTCQGTKLSDYVFTAAGETMPGPWLLELRGGFSGNVRRFRSPDGFFKNLKNNLLVRTRWTR